MDFTLLMERKLFAKTPLLPMKRYQHPQILFIDLNLERMIAGSRDVTSPQDIKANRCIGTYEGCEAFSNGLGSIWEAEE